MTSRTNINIVWTFLLNVKTLTDNLMPKLNFIWFYLAILSLVLSFLKGGKGLSVNPLAKSIMCLCQFCFLFEKETSPLLLPPLPHSYSYTHAVIHTNIHICPIIKNNSSLKLQFKPLINQILPWPDHGSCFSIDSFLFSIVL